VDYKLNIENLNNPADLQKLKSAISELAFDLDAIYTTTAPNLNISARQGVRAIYLNGATYEYWVNVDGGTVWQRQAGQSDVVLLTGDQTIAGIKTFTSIPILPASDPTTDHQAARKLYVDGKFNTTTGHDHDGVDSKAVSYTNLDNKPVLAGIQIFTSDGTFVAPTGVTKVYLTMVAGGGGGCGANGSYGGGGGGSGSFLINYPFTVVPSSTYAVVVGAGGAGSAYGYYTPGTGGSTSFSTVSTVGGTGGGQGGSTPGGGGAGGVSVKTSKFDGDKGGNNNGTSGGVGAVSVFSSTVAGGINDGTPGTPGTANTGGGGGGGGNHGSSNGGTGGSGICIVMY